MAIQIRNQPIQDRPTSGSYGWVMFWVIVALFVIGVLAYSVYKPAYQNGTTMGDADTTTTNSQSVNTLNNNAAGNNTAGAYVMPDNTATPANNSPNPNTNTTGTPAQ